MSTLSKKKLDHQELISIFRGSAETCLRFVWEIIHEFYCKFLPVKEL